MEAKEIISILEAIQPQGFNWTDITASEMVKFKAVADISFKAGKEEGYKLGFQRAVAGSAEQEMKLAGKQEVIERLKTHGYLVYDLEMAEDKVSLGDLIISNLEWQALQHLGRRGTMIQEAIKTNLIEPRKKSKNPYMLKQVPLAVVKADAARGIELAQEALTARQITEAQ